MTVMTTATVAIANANRSGDAHPIMSIVCVVLLLGALVYLIVSEIQLSRMRKEYDKKRLQSLEKACDKVGKSKNK